MLRPKLVEHINKEIIIPEVKNIVIKTPIIKPTPKPTLKPKPKPIAKPVVKPLSKQQIDMINTQSNGFLLNILGIICLGIFVGFLYYRMRNKSKNKETYEKRIFMLNQGIQKFENENDNRLYKI